jgi:poly-gamma-glutamate capsule biosynthesis protein CapA/YwtB (metallophosphatase superfamily)
MIFTGDLYIGNASISMMPQVKARINNSDLIVSNFEAVISSNRMEKRADKYSNLQFTDKSFVHHASAISVKKLFTLGNNHIHDLGEEGAVQTREYLSNHENVDCFGLGTLADVRKPYIYESGGIRVGFLAVSTSEPEVNSILAGKDKIGVLDYNDPCIFSIIESTREVVDYFVILPHWGLEYINYPSHNQRDMAKKWIDAGVDLIIGHHPHVIQGKEQYKGKWIYYSLGNYIFPDFFRKNGTQKTWSKNNCYSILLDIQYEEDIRIDEVGLYYDTRKNNLATSKTAEDLLNEFSISLNADRFNKKQYYQIQQKALYQKLKNDFSFIQNLKALIFAKRKGQSNFRYLLGRLGKKIISLSGR